MLLVLLKHIEYNYFVMNLFTNKMELIGDIFQLLSWNLELTTLVEN
jgi:hypothetical protein